MTLPPLAETLDRAAFYSLSVVKSGDQWQASCQVEPGNSFRIRTGSSPSAALAALFPAAALIMPPPPYQVRA